MNDVERMKKLSLSMTFFKENYEREDDFKIVLIQEASMVDLYKELICKKRNMACIWMKMYRKQWRMLWKI